MNIAYLNSDTVSQVNWIDLIYEINLWISAINVVNDLLYAFGANNKEFNAMKKSKEWDVNVKWYYNTLLLINNSNEKGHSFNQIFQHINCFIINRLS